MPDPGSEWLGQVDFRRGLRRRWCALVAVAVAVVAAAAAAAMAAAVAICIKYIILFIPIFPMRSCSLGHIKLIISFSSPPALDIGSALISFFFNLKFLH